MKGCTLLSHLFWRVCSEPRAPDPAWFRPSQFGTPPPLAWLWPNPITTLALHHRNGVLHTAQFFWGGGCIWPQIVGVYSGATGQSKPLDPEDLSWPLRANPRALPSGVPGVCVCQGANAPGCQAGGVAKSPPALGCTPHCQLCSGGAHFFKAEEDSPPLKRVSESLLSWVSAEKWK